VEDTLPGLADAGAANSSLAESFNRILLMLMARTPGECAGYRKELNVFNELTSQSLQRYTQAAFAPEEQILYNHLIEERQKYLGIREQVMTLIEQKQQAQAMALCKDSLLPVYLDYKSTAEKLLKFNVLQGQSRGETILGICTVTQYVVAGIGILLFVTGLLIGLFK
jgi:hypothetical protein